MASLGNWSLSILFLDPPIVHFHLFLPSLSHSSGTSFSASSFFSLKILRRLVRALQSKGKESVGLTRRNQTEEWWWVCSHRLDCAPARAWTRQWARGGAALINTADNNNNSITIAGSIETAFAKRIAIDWFKFLGHFSFFFSFCRHTAPMFIIPAIFVDWLEEVRALVSPDNDGYQGDSAK